MKAVFVAALAAVSISVAFAADTTKDYADPSGAFAIRIPADWNVTRTAMGDAGFNTEIKQPQDTAGLGIINMPQANPPAPASLEPVGKGLLNAVLANIAINGKVLSQNTYMAKFRDADALRCDLKYRPNDSGKPESGYMLVLLGQKNAFLAFFTARDEKPDDYQLAETALLTLALESGSPFTADVAAATDCPGGACLLNTAALQSTAQVVQSGFKRDPADKVLVAGEPPLTYRSIVSFAELMRFVFDVDLTETEFALITQVSITNYGTADAHGKAILARGAANILSQNSSDPKVRAKQKADLQKVMSTALSQQAQRGIPYAVALWQAIERRNKPVVTVQAERPACAQNAGFKTQMTQADLQAALEMLYFMWVASGRDPKLVTQDAVAGIQTALVQQFATFPPQVQYILANAQQVYSSLRGQWEQADAGARRQMAAQFGQTLDSLGLTMPRPNNGGGGKRRGGAWSNVSASDASNAGIEAMANSAFLASNSWYNTSH